MRTAFFSSLLAVLLVTTPVVATANTAPAPVAAVVQQATETVNINTADAEALQKGLTGVGLAKAAAIVAYRDTNGAFTSIDELVEVNGIGKTLLEKNRDRISLE